MGMLSIWHWVIVLLLVVLLFGRGRISALLEDMGQGIGSFRRELRSRSKDRRANEIAKPKNDSLVD